MKTIFICLSALFLTTPVAAQKNFNGSSGIAILGDYVHLELVPHEINLHELEGLGPVSGAVLPPLIDFTVKAVEEKIRRNALKYKGTYRVAESGEAFYPNPAVIALPELRLTRTILDKHENRIPAVSLTFLPELSSDKTAFRYRLDETYNYAYSVAKTKGDHDYIDVTVEVTVKAIYVDKNKHDVKTLRTVLMTLPMVHVDDAKPFDHPVVSGWIPLPPNSTGRVMKDQEQKVTKTVEKGNSIEKTVTTTINHKEESFEVLPGNAVQYEVELVVTEENPYKIRAEQKKQFIEKTGSAAGDVAKAIVEVVTDEDE